VLIGSVFGKRVSYEARLRKRASRIADGRVVLPGIFRSAEVAQSWTDFDCAVHVPLSENCGGVLEPLLAAVPVVASSVGGIPELVVDGITGRLVPARNPKLLANVVLEVLADLDHYRKLALKGQKLVRRMFDINRTGREVYETYRSVLHGAARPSEFYSGDYLSTLRMTPETGPGVPIDDLQQRDEMAV
jgi:glycosyltransferase involved in cell wall biosynthesis